MAWLGHESGTKQSRKGTIGVAVLRRMLDDSHPAQYAEYRYCALTDLASLPKFADKRQGSAWVVESDEVGDFLKVKFRHGRKAASHLVAHGRSSIIA